MATLIGRDKEIAELTRIEQSGKAEFVAVFGRRRVGKTFLIQQHYRNRFSFAMTGSIDATHREQLHFFTSALREYGLHDAAPKNWNEAFDCLQILLQQKSTKERMIVFIDELPCLDTPRSGFVRALEHFWNSWGANQDNLMLIVCGSATSWMVRNILDNRGGLHNRVTHEIHLHQFALSQVEQYLEANGMDWDRLTIAQTYMVMGGIPYYLSLLNPRLSLAENIDELFFNENGELRREYTRLYRSLFRNAEPYTKIIELLSTNHRGLTRKEIADGLKLESGGKLTQLLDDLTYCDFIRYYTVKSKRIKTSDGLYVLTDFFSLFHLAFCQRPSTDSHYWTHQLGSPRINNWYGLAFERVTMAHIPQIKQALRIDSIHTEYYSWRSKADTNPRAQIDLLIERADRMINLCEIKYSSEYYAMTKEEQEKILRRISSFKAETDCKKGIVPTLITTYGLQKGKHSDFIKAEICLDDLFD